MKRKSFQVKVNPKEGEIRIFEGKDKIAWCDFYFDEHQITATDIQVESARKRRKGLGTILIDALKILAKKEKKPIYLYSAADAVKFYKKCGFERVVEAAEAGKITVGNLEEGKKLKDAVNKNDMVWLPKSLKGRPVIYV